MHYCKRLVILSLLLYFCSHGTLYLLSSEGAAFRYLLLYRLELAIHFATG